MNSMRSALLLFFVASISLAAPTVEVTDWRSACEGSEVQIVRDAGVTQAIRASVVHFNVIVEWTIHFVGGMPVSAEYRESVRERYSEGPRAGELTGTVKLTTLQTWTPERGRFRIAETNRRTELGELLKLGEKKPKDAPQNSDLRPSEPYR